MLEPATPSTTAFPYHIVGTSSLIGEVVSTERWAAAMQIPHRSGEGIVDGALARRILGVHGKSWSPELFRDPMSVVRVAREALDRAQLRAADLDAVIVVTCTPYEIQLDQDSFRFLRSLGVPDHVPPLQISAGCAGVARAAQVAAMLNARHALIVSYNIPSCYMVGPDGSVNRNYQRNTQHPFGDILWTSPGIFSDGIGALALRRDARASGFVFYSRDSQGFGEDVGFEDPLVHFLGGGALHPIGSETGEAMACYGMNGEQVKKYYSKGMLLNHQLLSELRPHYEGSVARLYTHQASPALVADFLRRSELPLHKAPTNARELGNLVTPCTIKLLDDDITSGLIKDDDVCFSVVGAGPERGVLLTRVEADWATPSAA